MMMIHPDHIIRFITVITVIIIATPKRGLISFKVCNLHSSFKHMLFQRRSIGRQLPIEIPSMTRMHMVPLLLLASTCWKKSWFFLHLHEYLLQWIYIITCGYIMIFKENTVSLSSSRTSPTILRWSFYILSCGFLERQIDPFLSSSFCP